jgi:hypothetical protein
MIGLIIVISGPTYCGTFVVWYRISIAKTFLNSYEMGKPLPEACKLREASFATRKLLVQLNNSFDPAEIRDLLSQITSSEIYESVAVFTPLYINYGRNIKIGKNVFINFDCFFLDLGGITIEDGVMGSSGRQLLSRRTLIPYCQYVLLSSYLLCTISSFL